MIFIWVFSFMFQGCFSTHLKKKRQSKTHLTSTKITESKKIFYNLSCTAISCEAETMQHKEGDKMNGLV